MDYIFRYLALKFLGQNKEEDSYGTTTTAESAVSKEVDRSGPAEDETQLTLEFEGPKIPSDDPLVGQTLEAFMQGLNHPESQGTSSVGKVATFRNQEDAPPCTVCGTITVRSGACYSCPSCGASTGCG